MQTIAVQVLTGLVLCAVRAVAGLDMLVIVLRAQKGPWTVCVPA